MTTLNEAHAPHRPKTIMVVFNKKYNVTLEKREYTGAELKAAAIAQGVGNVKPTDVLFLIHNRNHREIIGDTDTVKVREGMEFACIADDDNS